MKENNTTYMLFENANKNSGSNDDGKSKKHSYCCPIFKFTNKNVTLRNTS